MTLRIITFMLLLMFPLRVEHKHFPYDIIPAQCLAVALFYEGRGEGITGRLAIASVILNRASRGIPICDVISQPGQFSWWSQYVKNNVPLTNEQLGDILYEAYVILEQHRDGEFLDVTEGARHFAGKHVRNYWTKSLTRTCTIGNLSFYKVRIR